MRAQNERSDKQEIIVTTILHNRRVWLTSDGRLEVYDNRLATKINEELKSYDSGKYKFKKYEEAVYRLSREQIQYILDKFLIKKAKEVTNKITQLEVM